MVGWGGGRSDPTSGQTRSSTPRSAASDIQVIHGVRHGGGGSPANASMGRIMAPAQV